jgi:uncharacterized protein (TIRG00374 family)
MSLNAKRMLLMLRRPAVRRSFQAGVSVGLMALLAWLACQSNLGAVLGTIHWSDLVLGAALILSGTLVAVKRWQLVLQWRGVHESWFRLVGYYLFGQFYSTVLPTSVAGDAIRIYEVHRRGHLLGAVVAATFQDRVLGLGSILILGLAATLWFLSLLPPSLLGAILFLQVVGLLAVGAFLYPQALLVCRRCIWQTRLLTGVRNRWGATPWGERVRLELRRLEQLPQLSWRAALPLVVVSMSGVLLAMAAHAVLARSLQMEAGFLACCFVVPLVWIVKLLPVSLNGLGVGEGGFVWLLGLFAVPANKALALALAILGLQMCVSLLGGVLLLARLVCANFRHSAPTSADPQEGELRHAA